MDEEKKGGLVFPGLVVLLLAVAFGAGSLLNRAQIEKGEAEPTGVPEVQEETGSALGESDFGKLAESVLTRGKETAKVTMVEFSDPSCPYCAAVYGGNREVIDYLKGMDATWEAAMPRIEKEYVEKGLVRVVYHYFPGHGSGEEALKLIWCAQEQGKGWEAKEIVYKNQEKIEDQVALMGLMSPLGMDQAKLKGCVAGDFSAKIKAETDLGRSVGVGGTPMFFINGREISGAQGFKAFQKVIDEELAKE